MHDEQTLKWFDRQGKARPIHEPHGTPEDIRANLKPLKPHSWRLEGNKLIGQTDMGELVQFIPTDMIMTGVDDQGLPKLEKVTLT